MPQMNTYLFFDGTCADAMRFYERVLGGRIEALMTYAQSPMADHMPAADRDRVMHARLALDGGGVLMASDASGCDAPQQKIATAEQGMKPFSMTLTYASAEQANKVFQMLSEGGQVSQPMQKTFWAEAFGMLVDRFGTPWMINGGMQGN